MTEIMQKILKLDWKTPGFFSSKRLGTLQVTPMCTSSNTRFFDLTQDYTLNSIWIDSAVSAGLTGATVEILKKINNCLYQRV